MKWPLVPLGRLALRDPQYGANARAVPPRGRRPRYVRITDIDAQGRLLPQQCAEADLDDWHPFLLLEGDLLFARSGATVGKTYLYDPTDGPCVFAGYLIRFQFNRELVEPRYAFYFTRSTIYKEWVGTKKRVVAQPNINGSEYAGLMLPLPPPSEQRRIVDILDQADALRRKGAEADAQAERILPALFHKTFGDPVSNAKGWTRTSLAEAGAAVRYGLGQPPEPSSAGVPLIRATNIHRGCIDEEGMMLVDPASVPGGRNAFLSADEVIVVRSGAYTGDIAQVTERWAGSVIGYDLVVTPGSSFCGEYLEAYLLTPHIQKNYFGLLKTRAGQPHLNADQLAATPVLQPPKGLQLRFAAQVSRVRQLRDRLLVGGRRVEGLFTLLLHRAFSGHLTAGWREAHVKELVREMELQTRALQKAAV